ncbi:hypothetical protein B0H16DRAFT_1695874 [Mycena metata]|uniref:Uncharacterized protein n=1 Tax=Mycena metata TaxID=1033252 RepID=A0AAD7I3J4_9AGAR|nr:hypothetical protein B0H16DRAFT_1695874 [Mycena metata]
MSLSRREQWVRDNVKPPGERWQCPLDPSRDGRPSDGQSHSFGTYLSLRGERNPARFLEQKLFCPRRCTKMGTVWQPPPEELIVLREQFNAFEAARSVTKSKGKAAAKPRSSTTGLLNGKAILKRARAFPYPSSNPISRNNENSPSTRGKRLAKSSENKDEPVIISESHTSKKTNSSRSRRLAKPGESDDEPVIISESHTSKKTNSSRLRRLARPAESDDEPVIISESHTPKKTNSSDPRRLARPAQSDDEPVIISESHTPKKTNSSDPRRLARPAESNDEPVIISESHAPTPTKTNSFHLRRLAESPESCTMTLSLACPGSGSVEDPIALD